MPFHFCFKSKENDRFADCFVHSSKSFDFALKQSENWFWKSTSVLWLFEMSKQTIIKKILVFGEKYKICSSVTAAFRPLTKI